jgi:hypothetical protein
MSIPFSLPVLHRGRRRILLPLLVLALLFLFLFSSSHDLFGLPPALQGLRRVSPASIAALVQNRGVTEMHGLLYYAVHESDQALAHDAPDPTRPLDLSVYADGELAPKPDWLARVKHLDAEAPLIVFSKVRLSAFFCLLMAGMAELFILFLGVDVLPVGGVLGLLLVPRVYMVRRYSRRAKDILARYELVPQPKIIEVDLRGT